MKMAISLKIDGTVLFVSGKFLALDINLTEYTYKQKMRNKPYLLFHTTPISPSLSGKYVSVT